MMKVLETESERKGTCEFEGIGRIPRVVNKVI